MSFTKNVYCYIMITVLYREKSYRLRVTAIVKLMYFRFIRIVNEDITLVLNRVTCVPLSQFVAFLRTSTCMTLFILLRVSCDRGSLHQGFFIPWQGNSSILNIKFMRKDV